VPAELGSLRFATLRGVALDSVQVEIKTSLAADETEGWTDWARLVPRDGAHLGGESTRRYLKLRIAVPAEARKLRDRSSHAVQPAPEPPSGSDRFSRASAQPPA